METPPNQNDCGLNIISFECLIKQWKGRENGFWRKTFVPLTGIVYQLKTHGLWSVIFEINVVWPKTLTSLGFQNPPRNSWHILRQEYNNNNKYQWLHSAGFLQIHLLPFRTIFCILQWVHIFYVAFGSFIHFIGFKMQLSLREHCFSFTKMLGGFAA